MTSINAKAGDYIVLLTSCNGGDPWEPSIPIGYVYELTSDYSPLNLYVKTRADFRTTKGGDGWSSSSYDSRMEIRMATGEEIIAYRKAGGPIKALNTNQLEYAIY